MARISDLTLEQKATFVTGAGFWSTQGYPEAGIERAVVSDGPHGLRFQDDSGGSDHLGLNASQPATALPAEAATASTWNPETLRKLGDVLAFDAQRLGVDIVLGPGVNIKRSPLGGRSFEYFAEDPHLAGRLGAGVVQGLQEHGVGVSVKHFAANNQETDRMTISADIDERTLREIYLAAFEYIVKTTRPATLMCAYNKINDVKASEDHWLLTEVLRDEWGFDGYVMSDWGAVDSMPKSVAGGLDLTMPHAGAAAIQSVVTAVENGTLEESLLDQACERIVSVHERLRASLKPVEGMTAQRAHEIARAAAAESIVMLKNDADTLPLANNGGTIAVIGEFAHNPRYRGGGSSQVSPTQLDTLLDSLPGATERTVTFAPGFTFSDDDDPGLRSEAVAAASGAEVTILMLGLPDSYESEGFDRSHMSLPATQLALLKEIAEVTESLIVVLTNGAVVDMSEITPRADAILEAWIGGQASGSALADVLVGAVEPGGRLAETIPLRIEDTPAHLNWPGHNGHVLYGERVYVGYRYYDTLGIEVAYPFGFGLGYTTFERHGVSVEVPDPSVAAARVRLTVANTGERRGSDVVQVYVHAPNSRVDRPRHELRGFAKVTLDPGESREVSIELDDRAFAYWDEEWVVEPGEYLVEVAESSRSIYSSHTITLEVPELARPLHYDSTLLDWMEHPVGSQVLSAVMAAAGPAVAGVLDDPDLIGVVGGMPMRKSLSMFAGEGDPDTAYAALLAQVDAQMGS
ncbi:MAG: glycoside hydrolase family 3 C-terminal domain-containing protein [Ruaniaceae bacterium]|nr:glycoside hydrolase family 3 C-terminal domain-containing protein [Ruaniaceae bacterium]